MYSRRGSCAPQAVGIRTIRRSTSAGSTRRTRGPLRYAGSIPAAIRRRSVLTLKPVRSAAWDRVSNWRRVVVDVVMCASFITITKHGRGSPKDTHGQTFLCGAPNAARFTSRRARRELSPEGAFSSAARLGREEVGVMDDTETGLWPKGQSSARDDLLVVARLLFDAAGVGMTDAIHDGVYDLRLDCLALQASLASAETLALFDADADLDRRWVRLASEGNDFFGLVLEAEQVLASRPIDEWPRATSHLVVTVCDLIADIRRCGPGYR